MADNEVLIELVARVDKAEAALSKFEKDAEKSATDAGDKYGKAFGVGLKSLAVAGAAALAGLAYVFKQGIDAAIEDERALSELNNALARTGQYSKEASEDFQRFATQMQNTTVFADDQIMSNAALIQSLGKLSTEGLKQATQAAADLSAALGIDLRTASTLVGKAAVGEVGSFGRYGLAIKEGASNAETFANALAKINAQFGGAAAGQVATFGGRVAQLSNTFGDFMEAIGNLVINSPVVVAVLGKFAEKIKQLTTAMKEDKPGSLMDSLTMSCISFAKALNDTVIGSIESMTRGVVSWMKVIGAAADFINDILGVAVGLGSVDQAMDSFAEKWQAAGEIAVATPLTTPINDFMNELQYAAENAPPLMESIKNNTQSLAESFTGISWDGFVNSFKMSIEKMNELSKNTMGQIKGTFITGFTGAFAAIGNALANGENAFAAFGKAILGMFGDMAMQLGQFYFILGLANLWLNPGAAAMEIAGGLALMVLGGALKGMAGGGGGGGGTASSGASVGGGEQATSPIGESTSSLQASTADQKEPGTNVVVNVQGNILDRRETGLEIADVINESFSTGGIVLAKGAVV